MRASHLLLRTARADLLSHLFLTALLGVVFGCGGGLVSAPQTADATEIAELKQKIVELERKTTVAEVEIGRLRQQVVELEKRLKAAIADSNAMASPLASRQDEIPQSHIDDGVIQPSEPDVESTELTAKDLALETTEAVPPRVTTMDPVPVPPPGSGSKAPATEARRLYDEAYTAFHMQRYSEAESLFQLYLARYSDTDLADNAQFWIGECRYARKDFEGALEAFSVTVERYPEGNKIADALLKAGKCLEAMGDDERARATYEEIQTRFPGSAAAALAREQLVALK